MELSVSKIKAPGSWSFLGTIRAAMHVRSSSRHRPGHDRIPPQNATRAHERRTLFLRMLARIDAMNAPSRDRALFARAGHVLIDEDLVAVWIEQHEAGGPCGGLIGLGRYREASARERLLDVAHVVVVGQRCARAIPAGVIGSSWCVMK